MEKFKRAAGYSTAALGAAITMTLFMVGAANASTTSDPGEEAIQDLGTKVTLYGAAVLAVAGLAIGIGLALKYMRKGRNAA
jgi:type IV secretory pathway VirB2 component (pilin)